MIKLDVKLVEKSFRHSNDEVLLFHLCFYKVHQLRLVGLQISVFFYDLFCRPCSHEKLTIVCGVVANG